MARSRRIGQIEHRLREWMEHDRVATAIAAIRAVSLLTATAATATAAVTMDHANASNLAARPQQWYRLAPSQTSSARVVELLRIKKRDDTPKCALILSTHVLKLKAHP
jgi:hypothetical protein